MMFVFILINIIIPNNNFDSIFSVLNSPQIIKKLIAMVLRIFETSWRTKYQNN